MALLPKHSSTKRRLFAPPKPNYQDFSGPPNGDYVRYVEEMMAWAEQEQERLRLKALGEKGRVTSAGAWGRQAAASASQRSGDASAEQPGSVRNPLQQLVRKAQTSAQKLQQQAVQAARTPQPGKKGAPKMNSWVALLIGIVAVALIFWGVPEMLPFVIIVWVVYNVIRSVRAASTASKS